MYPVARELASVCGVLEPILTKVTLQEQIDQLRETFQQNGRIPLAVIGHSWGAWLGYFIAAYHPELVSKLILIGSGPYEQKYVGMIQEAQMSRLTNSEKAEYQSILAVLNNSSAGEEAKTKAYWRLGELVTKADTYDAVPPGSIQESPVDDGALSYHEALVGVQRMRYDGSLLALAKQITCPVAAIHGDCDTRPAEGVEKPLSSILADFHMVVLPKCGHTPWKERYAKDQFYKALLSELT